MKSRKRCRHSSRRKSSKARAYSITAGPTFEPIDAVRGITNMSSGKMGYAIARAALGAGAEVTLVSGPVSLPAPVGARITRVETAAQMFEAVKQHVARTDIYIGVAAVADYRVDKPRQHKIKKTDEAQSEPQTGAQPGHSGLGGVTPEAAVLRRFCGREPQPRCLRRARSGAGKTSR